MKAILTKYIPPNDVTIRFASVEDADNFKKWAKKQIGYESEPGYPGQIRGPGMSIALSAVQRAKGIL